MAVPYLKKYGVAVIENGYDICMIRPGEKRPFGENWEAKQHTPKMIKAAAANGKAAFGVGIKTERTPGVDIDCYDLKIVNRMIRFTEERLGETLQRVGNAPKTLLVYRTDQPFPKVQSKIFIDDQDRPVKLEVLAAGQQFVALHIHPDTHEPYRWLNKEHPGIHPWETLHEITEEDAHTLVEEFTRLCRKKGWVEKSSVNRMGSHRSDDPLADFKEKIELGDNELRKKLMMVPNAEDYEMWFHVGMALYHQYEGDDIGLEMWHEWSSQANNYDQDALDDKWDTFDVEGKKREPITARFILKQATDEEQRLASEELKSVKQEIRQATTIPAINAVAARVKKLAFDMLTREALVKPIQESLKDISGITMSPNAVRKMIAYENPENRKIPYWLEAYVYAQEDESFYSRKTRTSMSARAFDASFGRYMLTKKDVLEGRAAPENSASLVALHRFQIPTVTNKMYMPGEEDIFEVAGINYVNTYSAQSLPEVPEELTRKEKWAIGVVRQHFHHLFPESARERKLLLDYLAYIVQENKRCNWCPVIQGCEGDGKTTIGDIMRGVLGRENFSTILGENLAEQYSSWAEGVQFCVIEEVRLHGKNRFDVINKMKPYIANYYVPVRRMRVDTYNVVNTISYLMTTNHKDGVPVTAGDTRYYPMFSQWQDVVDLDAFRAENPNYYADLADAATNYPGALRKWLLEVKIRKDFSPVKRAPIANAKAEMIFLSQSDEEDALQQVLKDSDDPLLSRELLDSARLSEAMLDAGAMAPQGKAMKMMLSEAGFTYLDRVKIEGKACRLWTKTPRDFRREGKTDTRAVRNYIRNKSAPAEPDGGDAD